MRIAILSDIHSNLAAFEAVLRHAQKEHPVDGVWALGDIVGYGPQPRECLALLREVATLSLAGNHDLAAIGGIPLRDFNPHAAAAARWTADRLLPEEQDYIQSLSQVLVDGHFTLVHGSLRQPIWEYLVSEDAALEHFQRQKTPFGLVGHSHLPLVARRDLSLAPLQDGDVVALDPDEPLVLNPGSVGQPRDGDPRAAYAVYDSATATVSFHRVEYEISATQKLMREAGLPLPLIARLDRGL